MRKPEEIQKDILLLMDELFQAQEEEKQRIRNELSETRADISRLESKNKRVAQILLED